MPSTADRWQGTTIGKAKLESPATRTPYQLWIIEYSEQSHVEHERETHGNMNSVVRIVIVMFVVLLLCVPQDTSNTSCTELTLFRKFSVKMYDRATRLPISLGLLQLGLNCMYGCRDNFDRSCDSPSSCSKLLNANKCGKVSKSALLDMSCTDAYESDCRSLYSTLLNVKKCGKSSKCALFDMLCTVAYDSCGVVNDRLMLQLQIVFKWVQLRTGRYICR